MADCGSFGTTGSGGETVAASIAPKAAGSCRSLVSTASRTADFCEAVDLVLCIDSRPRLSVLFERRVVMTAIWTETTKPRRPNQARPLGLLVPELLKKLGKLVFA